MTDYTTMTDEELRQIQSDVSAEISRRWTMNSIPEQINTLNAGYLEAEGTKSGEDWRQPTGAHDAYPKDWKVTHDGKTWQSTVTSNVWEPGVSGWHEYVEEGSGSYPDWVQPTGAHDVYNTGDQVHYVPDDKNYESTIDNNSWSPVDYPQGWTEITEEPA